MDLHIVKGSVGLGPLVGVARVTVHVSVRVWGTTVTEEGHNLVDRLLMSREVVPEHRSVLQVGLWVALLCVNEKRELRRVAEEEDGCVVVNPIPIALISIELDRETSRVTSSVWRTLLTTDGGETGDQGGLLADLAEHVDGSKMADIMGDHEFCDSRLAQVNYKG